MTATDPSTSTSAEPAPSKPASTPASILVADDEHLVASGLATNLTDLGFQVVGPATNGAEAIRLCEAIRPDMAILDIRMSEIDGLAAARTIFERYGIPSVILSAYSDDEYATEAAQAGVFGYLLKPVSQDQLRVAITVAWAQHLDTIGRKDEISGLKQRLESRKTIEQAKWILVKRKGIDEPEAMRTLQRHARNNRRPLADVAQSVIDNENLFSS
jgi:response regulator NasT